MSTKQVHNVARWEKFLELQEGCYPASLAATKLRMTPQGVYQASQRGWITYFQLGRSRLYGKKDVLEYRFKVSRKYKDNRPLPSNAPKCFNISEDVTT